MYKVRKITKFRHSVGICVVFYSVLLLRLIITCVRWKNVLHPKRQINFESLLNLPKTQWSFWKRPIDAKKKKTVLSQLKHIINGALSQSIYPQIHYTIRITTFDRIGISVVLQDYIFKHLHRILNGISQYIDGAQVISIVVVVVDWCGW